MTLHPRPWVLLRAERERLLSVERVAMNTGAPWRRVLRIRGLLRIVEEQLAVELERAAE